VYVVPKMHLFILRLHEMQLTYGYRRDLFILRTTLFVEAQLQ
jgi:hypothetical protein